jgi:hypothetical protein
MAARPLSARVALAALVTGAVLLGTASARAQLYSTPFDSLLTLDYTRDRLDLETLRALRPDYLRLLRGVVFGRHGRVFRNEDIQEWLESQDWYHPDSAFTNASLTDVERTNLDVIRQVEAENHSMVEPGDLRWWQERRMHIDQLGTHTRMEWAVLRAEVEAVHGRSFPGEPWLQRYFEDRYWYRADDRYDAGRLSAVERANLALIDSLARAQGAGALAPCDMGLYESRPVTVDVLRGAGFATLRILRNEIYARRGMRFPDGQLSDWFTSREWYEPQDNTAVELTPLDQRNVAIIAAYERSLRESLLSAPIDTTLLWGLFAEEAHRLAIEVYARHGRVFRRKWDQDYVSKLAGYRPDPGYTDARLTEVERANIAALVRYEKNASSIRGGVEG